jgi:hypothetical protein
MKRGIFFNVAVGLYAWLRKRRIALQTFRGQQGDVALRVGLSTHRNAVIDGARVLV